jgi:anaphase-promoting complex subunit 6
MVYHLLNATDKAIIKYHEALSVDPINGHVIELLDLALKSDTAKWPVRKEAFPGGGEAFEKTMLRLREKYSKFVKKGEGKSGDTARHKSDDEMSVG